MGKTKLNEDIIVLEDDEGRTIFDKNYKRGENMSEEGESIPDPKPIILDSSNTFIKYQGLKIKLQDLLNELNDADLLPESSKVE